MREGGEVGCEKGLWLRCNIKGSTIVEGNGNVINKDFKFVITGNLVTNLVANAKNFLSPDEINNLWIPKLVYYNTEDRLETMLDEQSTVTIKQEGGYQTLENKRKYKGENTIYLSRLYNVEFICIFEMLWYRFDTQICSMAFVLDEKLKDAVDIDIDM